MPGEVALSARPDASRAKLHLGWSPFTAIDDRTSPDARHLRHFRRANAAAKRGTKRQPLITVLAGGVGAARFFDRAAQGGRPVGNRCRASAGNTGDDLELYGLHVSPDLDTVTYTVSGNSNPATGWGLVDAIVDGDEVDRAATGWPLGSVSATA